MGGITTGLSMKDRYEIKLVLHLGCGASVAVREKKEDAEWHEFVVDVGMPAIRGAGCNDLYYILTRGYEDGHEGEEDYEQWKFVDWSYGGMTFAGYVQALYDRVGETEIDIDDRLLEDYDLEGDVIYIAGCGIAWLNKSKEKQDV